MADFSQLAGSNVFSQPNSTAQGWFDGPIHKGANSTTITTLGMAKGNFPTIQGTRKPGIVAKILADMGLTQANLGEGISKANYPVQQASINDITGPSFGGGGGFASMVGRGSDDFGIS